jgi:hypothetical protein
MKYISVLFGAVLIAVFSTAAQTNFAQSVSLAAPAFAATPAVPIASLTQPALSESQPVPGPFASLSPLAAISPAEPPQAVQGVFEKYNYDVYVGYTFFRFYEVPGVDSNMNGVNGSLVYWYRDRLGADAEVVATYGHQPGINSWQVFYGVGPRVRWVLPKGIDLWAHVLVGGDYMTPQTPYGGQAALAGLVGAGVDLNGHHRHMAIRIALDGVGTHYYGTFQASPKASVGIVYKF